MTVRITPLVHSGAVVELSSDTNIFEKEVLPYGRFGYKGNSFEITSEWVDEAIKAFEDKAFDQTVVALADENNSHNVDKRPDRYGGEVLKFKKTSKGLSAVVQLTNKVADLVRGNKKLGVSVRFREGYTREADGRSWPVAIDQVLGTLDPRITGMGPWKEITLSNIADGIEVKDSSSEEWEMPETVKDDKDTGTGTDNTEDKVTLTREEYDALQKLLKSNVGSDNTDSGGTSSDSGTSTASGGDVERKPTELSNEQQRVIELSNEVARNRYERDSLAWKQAGVPPRLVELAAPVLSSYDEVRVVTLSNDGNQSTTDARTVVRAILDECKGIVNLSNEQGTSQRGDDEVDKEFKAMYDEILGQANQF